MAYEREEIISWVLDFIYTDIEKLSEEEILKMGIDLNAKLFTRTTFLPGLNSAEIRSIHDDLNKFFKTYLETILRKEKKRSLNLPNPPIVGSRFLFISDIHGEEEIILGGAGGASLEEEAVEKLIRLFDYEAIKIKYFQECEYCKRLLFNIKKKRFCSPNCNWKFNALKARGEKGSKKRDLYNKKQKKIMKERYDKKTKKKLGEKVKVGRNK